MTTAAAPAWVALAEVMDPEIPVLSVVDLGIVRDVVETADGTGVRVTVTPTYSGCPATEVIVGQIRTALSASYDAVDVRLQLSPPWTTDWISDSGRDKLRRFGIAPPNGRAVLPIVFVTWDENDYSAADNQVATVVIGPTVPPGTRSHRHFTHYALLRTAESLLKVGRLGAAATAHSMRRAFNL